MFITCSADRRIVMWSATTRRVKVRHLPRSAPSHSPAPLPHTTSRAPLPRLPPRRSPRHPPVLPSPSPLPAPSLLQAVWALHTRGVRCLSVFETTLLSGSFDTDARTYDLVSKEPVGLLRGHRRPVAAVQLMCERAATEREHRAITVDEGGEFRLWNIYVKVRGIHPCAIHPPTLLHTSF